MNYHRIAIKNCAVENSFVRRISQLYLNENVWWPMEWIESIPLYEPIYKNGRTFTSFIPHKTYKSLFSYLILRSIHEYIAISYDNHFRAKVMPMGMLQGETLILPPTPEMNEIFGTEIEQIQLGEEEEGMNTVGSFLIVLMSELKDAKKVANISYGEIDHAMEKTKTSEKMKITETLRLMERDERKVEDLMKNLRLGKWNEGQKKTLVRYDKKAYEQVAKENAEWHNILMFDANQTGENGRDVDAIAAEENEAANNNEADEVDISELAEDYMDGVYYNEDFDEE